MATLRTSTLTESRARLLCRHLPLLRFGGVYADVTTACMQPLQQWLPSGCDVVLLPFVPRPRELKKIRQTHADVPSVLFGAKALAAVPGHPLIQAVLHGAVKAVLSGDVREAASEDERALEASVLLSRAVAAYAIEAQERAGDAVQLDLTRLSLLRSALQRTDVCVLRAAEVSEVVYMLAHSLCGGPGHDDMAKGPRFTGA
jgi:hypothetical protein